MKSSAPRTVFVSGASRGLGRAIAEYWLTRGCEVWGSARKTGGLADLLEREQFHPVEMDLGDRDALLLAYESAEVAAQGFDLVVNNAGFGIFGELTEIADTRWENQITAMLTHTVLLIRRQIGLMKSRGSPANLVNISSLAVEFPLPFMSGYNVAKSGLSALSESLLMELSHTPIGVIDFRPGDYRTEFNDPMRGDLPQSESGGRLGTAWETLEKNIREAPEPEQAAADLHRAIAFNRRGVVRSGGWFQTVIAPFLLRFAPVGLARSVHWRYFGLR